ncbi:MAG TPA: hypothetical protein VL360_02165 [Gammaproteobacteria bacterium]|jgi:hypothetical protein|nr:hypothetical protein [Gammaproteobacteria bacterium]
MVKFADIPIEQAIELYYEKLNAMRNGDLTTLINLKKSYPDIFNKEIEKQVLDIIRYAKEFEASPRYKELRRMMLQEQLKIIDSEPV